MSTEIADTFFSEAFACIEQGLCYDEVNDWDATIQMYEQGLALLREGEKAENAQKSELYATLIEAKRSVEQRVKVLRKEGPKLATLAPTKEMESSRDKIRQELESVGTEEAQLLFYIPDGVQLFTVDGEMTTAPTYPSSLQILLLQNQSEGAPTAILQVGPWIYPLIRGQTPVLENEFGAFVVPNPTREQPDLVVGIILPTDTEQRVRDEFAQVLHEYTQLHKVTVEKSLSTEEKKRRSEKIALVLVRSGERLAVEVATQASKASSLIEAKSAAYRDGIVPNPEPTKISTPVKHGVFYIHQGSKIVAKCTRALLDWVGDMGVAVGKKLASGAQKGLGEGKAGSAVTGAITVLGGGITGVSTVWLALEEASKALCRNIANETVQHVRVKYGDEAATTTHNGLFAVGHGSLAAYQLWDLGPRSVAGRVARKAGLQVVSDLGRKGEKPSASSLTKKKL